MPSHRRGSIGRAPERAPAGGSADDPALRPLTLPLRENLLQTKLVPPPARRGTVVRSALLERLVAPDPAPAVGLFAPAGYGKSTLLIQWRERDARPFAWLTLDPRDNDPIVLLGYLAHALRGALNLSAAALAAVAVPEPSPWAAAVPRLGAAIAAAPVPFVLVIDDVHHLEASACADILVALSEHLPPGSRFAYAGRTAGALPLPRLVAGGRLTTIGAAELSLDDEEALQVVSGAGISLGPAQVRALNRAAEGWPAGLYLSALSHHEPLERETGTRAMATPTPADRQLLPRYVRDEVLDGLPAERRAFLLGSAALERLSGDLCDHVMQRHGSAAELRGLAEAGLFVSPLDDAGRWYRLHGLLRDLLLRELTVTESGLEATLRRRAADWFEAQGMGDEAIEYAMAAGDEARVLRLLGPIAQAAYNRGGGETVRRWFDWLEARRLDDHDPATAALGQLLFAFLGDPARAERCAAAAATALRRSSHVEPNAVALVALGRAIAAAHGSAQMTADADRALELLPAASPWRIAALAVSGAALALTGHDEAASDRLHVALAEYGAIPPRRRVAHTAAAMAAALAASLAMEAGAWSGARDQVAHARSIVRSAHLDDQAAGVVVDAMAARLAIHRGAAAQARLDLARGMRNRALLTRALPWQAVRTRLDLARACLALGNSTGARTLLSEVKDLLAERPALGTLADEADAIGGQLDHGGGLRSGPYSLTLAELRLLPLLGTHLTFREIGQRLFLSPNTVKSQALSIYRKLDASSRGEAVERAAEAGLAEPVRLAPPVALGPRIIPSG